jgi:hypothetical protein
LFDFIRIHPAQADVRPRAITIANVIENYSHLQHETKAVESKLHEAWSPASAKNGDS